MLYPTKLGLSLMAGCGALYLVALQAHSGLAVLLLGILIATLVLNVVGAWRAANSLDLVPPPVITCSEDQPAAGTWIVNNPTRRAAGLAEISSPWGMLFRVGAIPAGASAHLSPALQLDRRGVYPFRRLRVVSSYPFGLWACFKRLHLSGEIVVHPRVYQCPSPAAAGYEPMVGGHYHGNHRSSTGDRFHGVRPMQSGDPVKLIHWPLSSKGLGIMVKEFDEELSGRVALIVDLSDATAPNQEPVLNWVARCTASLTLAALDAGHQVQVTCLSQKEVHDVPPFADGTVVLEALARAVPTRGCLTRDELVAAVARLPRRAALTFVLTRLDPAFLTLLEQEWLPERRNVAVYLPEFAWHADTTLPVPVTYFGASDLSAGLTP